MNTSFGDHVYVCGLLLWLDRIFMKCDFGILCRKMPRKLKFLENWHSKRHTLFRGINEFAPFSTFLFDLDKIWNSKHPWKVEHCELRENWRQDRQYFYLHKWNYMCTCTGILLSVPSHTCCFRWLHFVPVWAGYCYCMLQKHHVTCTVIFLQKWSFWEYCGSRPRILSD